MPHRLAELIGNDTILNAISSSVAAVMFFTTYLTTLISKADTWIVKVPLGILILSIAFFNIARGIARLRNSDNEKHNE